MTGADAIFNHLERPGTPVHTLKIAVLDTSRRGHPVTLDEMRNRLAAHLGMFPRATQRVETVPGFGARPFWVDDPSFNLDNHLDEQTVTGSDDHSRLDAIFSELATKQLDARRPLWSMTLANGLASGQQAVVMRVHHAITDGLGAVNALRACTTESPGEAVALREAISISPEAGRRGQQYRAVARDLGPWLRGACPMLRDGVESWRRSRGFRRGAPDLPPFLGSHRNFCNTPGGAERVCASGRLSFEDLRAVAKATDASINGVLHTVIAGAMREELLVRGDDTSTPTVAAFGIAADSSDSSRCWGNRVTPTNVALFSNLADPLERLRHTARSCREGVELRRTTGLDMAARWADYVCRPGPVFQRILAYRLPWAVNHVTTANVPGPTSTRWLGEVEIVDYLSFAIAVAPSNLNITATSYAGSMNIGLVTIPEVLPRPSVFVDRMASSLAELVARCYRDRLPT